MTKTDELLKDWMTNNATRAHPSDLPIIPNTTRQPIFADYMYLTYGKVHVSGGESPQVQSAIIADHDGLPFSRQLTAI